jgi:mono/diheme cytochrome c family protein
MTGNFLTVFALMAFVLTSCARSYGGDTHNAKELAASAPPASNDMIVTTNAATNIVPIDARKLFLRNCAHCHGADARGDDGPDLHDLDFTDEWMANRIRKGKAGEMTAFAGKLKPAEIEALVAYVKTLK